MLLKVKQILFQAVGFAHCILMFPKKIFFQKQLTCYCCTQSPGAIRKIQEEKLGQQR